MTLCFSGQAHLLLSQEDLYDGHVSFGRWGSVPQPKIVNGRTSGSAGVRVP